jgi:hypothetical protein
MDDIYIAHIVQEFDVEFENLVDNFDREPDERREMRESLQP